MMRFEVTLPKNEKQIIDLGFSGTNPKTGETLGVTSGYFTKNGQPWFPVMGEFHFSRYPASLWEKEILKMKAGGITVVASYVFWIHHEEIEGQYDWTGDRSLSQFIALLEKHNMKMLLRVGPWAHGEARNGGFPDWLMNKGCELRSNNEEYLAYVAILFGEIGKQAKGHMFKDGGCIVGIQIENEYGHCGGFRGEKGRAHMLKLKKMAMEKGFVVPYYTATGWGGAVVVEGEMLPVLGAYADAPWDQGVEDLPANDRYVFSYRLNDEKIGSDQAGENDAFTYDPSKYPYATAELGGGIQVTKHRRPVVTAKDTYAMIFSQFGSGSNLLGYYMYHGGTNPKGKLTTLEESYASGGYSDLPVLSYDFQAVIGEYGELHESYRELKLLHYLINEFGSQFANSNCFIPKESASDPEDLESLRFSVLKAPEMSLLCLNNTQRHRVLTDKRDIQMTVEGIPFPAFDLLEGESIAYPFNWKIHDLRVDYATAQPFCWLGDDLYFWNNRDEMTVSVDGRAVTFAKEASFGKVRMLLLSKEQAKNAWKADGKLTFTMEKPETEKLVVSYDNENRFILPKLAGDQEAFLCIDFDGSAAKLYGDGELVADWFYTGLPWRVGLEKFKDRSIVNWQVEIEPLNENARIYFEHRPMAANRLNGIHIEVKK